MSLLGGRTIDCVSSEAIEMNPFSTLRYEETPKTPCKDCFNSSVFPIQPAS